MVKKTRQTIIIRNSLPMTKRVVEGEDMGGGITDGRRSRMGVSVGGWRGRPFGDM